MRCVHKRLGINASTDCLDYLKWSKDDLPMQNTQILNDDEQEMFPSSTMHEMIQITRCKFKKNQYIVQVQFQMVSIETF